MNVRYWRKADIHGRSNGYLIQIKLRPYVLSVLQQMLVKWTGIRLDQMRYVAEGIGWRLPIINGKRQAALADCLPLEFNISGISP